MDQLSAAAASMACQIETLEAENRDCWAQFNHQVNESNKSETARHLSQHQG